MNGFLQAMSDHGFSADASPVLECGNDDDQNFEMIKNFLQEQRPDGVFAAVEQYAMGVYKTCGQLGLSIPQDVKVICFSNMKAASYLSPSLTTITQPAFDMGKEAAAMLFKALDKKSFQL